MGTGNLNSKLKKHFYSKKGKWIDHRDVCKLFVKDGNADAIHNELLSMVKEGVLVSKDEFEQQGNVSNHVYLYRLSESAISQIMDGRRHRQVIIVTIVVGLVAAISVPKTCSERPVENVTDSLEADVHRFPDTLKSASGILLDSTGTEVDTTRGNDSLQNK